jgi:glycosyltransferase involved in cell wall biosynthesis
MKRLIVNDCLTTIPGTKTFWHDLQEWFGAEFCGGAYEGLADRAAGIECDTIIRNGSYFGPIKTKANQISLFQDIATEGPLREMQEDVILSSAAYVFNSKFTASKYKWTVDARIIPLPVDFDLFRPGNAMGLQQALSLPDGAVCWIGACREAGEVKGWDILLKLVRMNPDIPFVAVFKDDMPDYCPTNMRMFHKVPHEELVKIIGTCRVGLCTSRAESQHLAGIEMGACGLPMVAPQTGIYWERGDLPGCTVDGSVESYVEGIRRMRDSAGDPDQIRSYWQKEFSREVVRKQWQELMEEIECSGAS